MVVFGRFFDEIRTIVEPASCDCCVVASGVSMMFMSPCLLIYLLCCLLTCEESFLFTTGCFSDGMTMPCLCIPSSNAVILLLSLLGFGVSSVSLSDYMRSMLSSDGFFCSVPSGELECSFG